MQGLLEVLQPTAKEALNVATTVGLAGTRDVEGRIVLVDGA